MQRDATLADARKNGWVPGVSGVCSVLARPRLVNWQIEQAVLAALTLPRIEDEKSEDLLRRIRSDSFRQVSAAAAEGTRIHNAIEKHYQGKPYDPAYTQHVHGAVREIEKAFPEVCDWEAERSFGHPSGYGGRADLVSLSARALVDTKSKDLSPDDDTRLAYDQFIQLAAYAQGFGIEPDCRIASLFVSRTHPGHARIHVWDAADLCRGLAIFRSALTIWQQQKGYECGWE